MNSNLDEVCDTAGIDEDCNPLSIQNEMAQDGDGDGDGYVHTRCFNLRDDGSENRGTDCDDARPTVSPVGVEACDGLDNNCDGRTDEGVLNTFYFDYDNDNYGRSDMNMMSCTRPDGYALVGGDCDDGEVPSAFSSSVNPGATESCNGRDDDCDGMTDPGCDCVNGATLPCGMDVGACELGTQTCVSGDWGPCLGGVGPATEVCGGGDEDCDGLTDEPGASGERVFYRDADHDGYGDPDVSILACPGSGGAAPSGYLADSRDCYDSARTSSRAALVHPGATHQTVGYCLGLGSTCVDDGRYCSTNPVTCPTVGIYPSMFDYDCDGSAEPLPQGICQRNCLGNVSGPFDPETPADCGRDVPWMACTRSGTTCSKTVGTPRALPCN